MDKDMPISKKQLIEAMPWIAIFILLAGAFAPVDEGILLLMGFFFGTCGAVLLPYYREWKMSSETLKFSLKYFIPIGVAIMVTFFGLAFPDIMNTLNTEMAGYDPRLLYFGAVILGYGGKALFVGILNNLPFLGILREFASIVEEMPDESDVTEPASIGPFSSSTPNHN